MFAKLPLLLSLIFAALSCSCSGAQTPARTRTEVGTPCAVTADWGPKPVELRSEPGGAGKAMGSLAPGKPLVRLDTVSTAAGEWIEVAQEGRKGWVDAQALSCVASPAQAREILAKEAGQVVQALKLRDMNALAAFVHPVQGVRFSPYAFLDKGSNVRMTAAATRQAFGETQKRLWGTFDGTGAPIRMTFAEYYRRFLYDHDYAAAPKMLYDSPPAVKGNTHDNSREEYPNAIIVEFHFPGFQAEREGMDYVSLRLVFSEHRGAWYLVYLIHDQWTI
ncbi:MAG: hypothetical protein IT165_18705 [Bryobacterales bacterium]|nr:hypothetical protein [Bryobacterales bacterium]